MAAKYHVILVPGADGLPFAEDIEEGARRGARTLALTTPAYDGHPIDGQGDYYREAAARIGAAADAARATGRPVFAFGRNLGGSLLGHAAATGVVLDGMVMIGAIPALSDFRIHGNHPSARGFRARLDGDTSQIDRIAPLDLTASLRRLDPARCLLQIGRADDYMDDRSFGIFRDLEATYRVGWHDDVHAMVHPDTVAERWNFIDGLAEAVR